MQWTLPYTVNHAFDVAGPRNFRLKLETGVRNGDCLPGCFAATLEALHRGCITSRNLEPAAAKMRKDLVGWITKNWSTFPIFNLEMQVHELMALTHDLGATAKEREKAGPWPEDPEGRLARYVAASDRLYMSDAEMLCFSCWMYERGVPVCFRTWRCTGTGGAQGQFVSATPNPEFMKAMGVTEAVIVDLDHNGTRDSRTAHFKILDSASLQGLTDVVKVARPRPASDSGAPNPVRRRLVSGGEAGSSSGDTGE